MGTSIVADVQEKCIVALDEIPEQPILRGNFMNDSEKTVLKLGFELINIHLHRLSH